MAMADLSAESLRKTLDYDPETGDFTWRQRRGNGIKPGDIAGKTNDGGYRVIGIFGVRVMAHRLAWLHVTGDWPAGKIDHIDGRPENNRWSNLRDVSHRVNLENQKQAHANNKTGFLGVTKYRYGFVARIRVAGKIHFLGTYTSPEIAHQAYLDAKRKLHSGGTI